MGTLLGELFLFPEGKRVTWGVCLKWSVDEIHLTDIYNAEQLTMAIGDEIRDSTKLADSMNDSFEGARNRLRGTMNRMLRMAERTGVGWKVWVLFFIFIWCLFAYVWLF